MAVGGRSNIRHEVMTYSKVMNDAILAADRVESDIKAIMYGVYATIWHEPVVASS
jgi:hypothetical protein